MKIKKMMFVVMTSVCFTISSFTAFASEKPTSGTNITVVVPNTPEKEEKPEPKPTVPILYPVGVSENHEYNRREIIRVYELSTNENPDHIPRESFQREGYHYELGEIVKSEMLAFDSREHVETVTVKTASNDLETVLKLIAQTMEHKSDDGYAGILTLDVSTITTQSAGTKTNTSTARKTREYPHLSSNDVSLVPKTISDGGKTYALEGVDWKAGNMESVDYTELPQTYTAVATYSTSVSKTSVVGYNTTAEYKGVISKTSQDKTRYTVNFIGIPIVEPVISDDEKKEEIEPTTAPDIEITQSQQPQVDVDSSDFNDTGKVEEVAEMENVSKDNSVENITENQQNKMPSAIFMILLAVVIVIAYLLSKYGKNFINRFKKPMCLVFILTVTISHTQQTFASSLPKYGFGGNSTNEMHFDTVPTNTESNTQTIAQNVSLKVGYSPPTYQDGNLIGRLTVEKSNKKINIFEGESLASMNKGGGRFNFSGVNNGNTVIIGHNRGRSNGYFIFVKDLREGDILSLEMGGVTKRYAVTHQYTVSDTDFSPLMEFGDNRLTLVTCLENQGSMRRIAVAMEI